MKETGLSRRDRKLRQLFEIHKVIRRLRNVMPMLL